MATQYKIRSMLWRALAAAAAGLLSAASAQAQPPEPDAPDETQADARHVSGRLIAYTTPVGSSEIRASAIRPYRARWTTANGAIEEELEFADEARLRHTQRAYRNMNDRLTLVATETRMISRADLRSLSWARRHDADLSARAPFSSVRGEMRPGAFVGEMTTYDGATEPYEYSTPGLAFDGWIVGLVIAALPLRGGYWASLPTTTHIARGNHHLTARVVGEDVYETPQGEEIPVWRVAAEWVHLENGDVYDPGAAGSGGVYGIAKAPGGGVPYVVSYENAQASILWDGVRRLAPE
ncbi:MAG: hypothetical protein Tsb0010_09850 [Parvularculaceae bacterium]